MNTPQTLAENRLHKMADDEHQHQQNMTSIRQERAGMKVMKNELAELMGGMHRSILTNMKRLVVYWPMKCLD